MTDKRLGRPPVEVDFKKKYGHLTPLEEYREGGERYVRCRCDCGAIKGVLARVLVGSRTVTCGHRCKFCTPSTVRTISAERVREMRGAGKSCQQIASEIGLTRQRVYQLLKEAS